MQETPKRPEKNGVTFLQCPQERNRRYLFIIGIFLPTKFHLQTTGSVPGLVMALSTFWGFFNVLY